MPGTTPNRGYPYALGGEAPAGNRNIQDLAIAVDADMQGNAVKRTGDTMTGPLTLPADPAQDLQAATKRYVDAKQTAVSGLWQYLTSALISTTSWSSPRLTGTADSVGGFTVTTNGILTSSLPTPVIAQVNVQAENLNANSTCKFGIGWGRVSNLDHYMGTHPLTTGQTVLMSSSLTVSIDPGVQYSMWIYCSIPMDCSSFKYTCTALKVLA